jgi:hypothetical protein
MRMTRLVRTALALALCTAGVPAATAQSDDGAGFLPGAQFQRKLPGSPGYVCTATNALKDQQCSASCPSRDTADCEDAEGNGTPTCQCTKE